MTTAELNALPGRGVPHQNHDRLMVLARSYRNRETAAHAAFSGADRAEAPVHGWTADALACIALGKDADATLTFFRQKWAAYCRTANVVVATAPKIKRGPMAGHSSIHYRHVSENAWELVEIFVRSVLRW